MQRNSLSLGNCFRNPRSSLHISNDCNSEMDHHQLRHDLGCFECANGHDAWQDDRVPKFKPSTSYFDEYSVACLVAAHRRVARDAGTCGFDSGPNTCLPSALTALGWGAVSMTKPPARLALTPLTPQGRSSPVACKRAGRSPPARSGLGRD
ncbi:hypothetical protein BKA80DRAFT_260413 [Phyllosticta citrichinensis]